MPRRGRLGLPRSMSLAAQLLLTFVSLVAGSTIVLTVAAYRSSLASMEEDARRTARVAAETRDDAMTQLFVTRHQRAEGFPCRGAVALRREALRHQLQFLGRLRRDHGAGVRRHGAGIRSTPPEPGAT